MLEWDLVPKENSLAQARKKRKILRCVTYRLESKGISSIAKQVAITPKEELMHLLHPNNFISRKIVDYQKNILL